jgi:hypothetical protein
LRPKKCLPKDEETAAVYGPRREGNGIPPPASIVPQGGAVLALALTLPVHTTVTTTTQTVRTTTILTPMGMDIQLYLIVPKHKPPLEYLGLPV